QASPEMSEPDAVSHDARREWVPGIGDPAGEFEPPTSLFLRRKLLAAQHGQPPARNFVAELLGVAFILHARIPAGAFFHSVSMRDFRRLELQGQHLRLELLDFVPRSRFVLRVTEAILADLFVNAFDLVLPGGKLFLLIGPAERDEIVGTGRGFNTGES